MQMQELHFLQIHIGLLLLFLWNHKVLVGVLAL